MVRDTGMPAQSIVDVNLSLDMEGATDDHLLDRPLESLDAIRNSATMKGVLGWLNQPKLAVSARAK
jgi:hypothetical protein